MRRDKISGHSIKDKFTKKAHRRDFNFLLVCVSAIDNSSIHYAFIWLLNKFIIRRLFICYLLSASLGSSPVEAGWKIIFTRRAREEKENKSLRETDFPRVESSKNNNKTTEENTAHDFKDCAEISFSD